MTTEKSETITLIARAIVALDQGLNCTIRVSSPVARTEVLEIIPTEEALARIREALEYQLLELAST